MALGDDDMPESPCLLLEHVIWQFPRATQGTVWSRRCRCFLALISKCVQSLSLMFSSQLVFGFPQVGGQPQRCTAPAQSGHAGQGCRVPPGTWVGGREWGPFFLSLGLRSLLFGLLCGLTTQDLGWVSRRAGMPPAEQPAIPAVCCLAALTL